MAQDSHLLHKGEKEESLEFQWSRARDFRESDEIKLRGSFRKKHEALE